MKEKLEVVTNIVLIGLACVIGYHFWQARRTAENPPPAWVKVGDQLPSLPAYDWKAHDRTLVLVLRNGCRFCEESIPFYQKLAELEKSNRIDAHLIAVFPDDSAAVRQLVETERLAVEAFPGIELSQMRVAGTPTLILVDRQGRVSKVWIGELAAAGQAEVVTVISQAGANRPWRVAAELPR
ncbi:MAG TPA: hypothetical protein VG204_05645 [Terriglobia bacterium]|nr:hypothetical protein [Terriglobia bacterium]